MYSGSLQTDIASTLNTEKNKKKKQTATKKKKKWEERRRAREISAGVVSKKGQRQKTFCSPGFISCRDCEVNGFEMKWVYEGVARSQEARLSDCFVNLISLKLRLIFKKNLSLFPFFCGGGGKDGVKLGTVPTLFYFLPFLIMQKEMITLRVLCQKFSYIKKWAGHHSTLAH